MNTLLFSLLAAVLTLACSTNGVRTVAADKGDQTPKDIVEASTGDIFFATEPLSEGALPQRHGMMLEGRDTEFKGCIIYLEGFGDSMQNHYPMFNKLRRSGYRILAFDYLGQGGSEGSMDQMSISRIVDQTKKVWDYYAKTSDSNFHRNCAASKKRVIGWSTGGLAAYQLASEKWADAYALINPAIAPRWCVGETANSCLDNIGKKDIVTFPTLTRNKFNKYNDPHLEKVRPTGPKSAMLFTADLIWTAYNIRKVDIDKSQKMIFLLSGPDDAYVDTEEIIRVLNKHVKPFRMYPFANAYHELDNDLPEDANYAHQLIIDFFDGN